MHKDRKFHSAMPASMVTIMLVGLILCGLFGALYAAHHTGWMLTAAISAGIVAYHMLIRFIAPVILIGLLHRRYDYRSWWFRQRRWEPGLYQRLGVHRWKVGVPAWDPSQFSLEVHTFEEIAANMCHAEAVHELIMLLSFTALLFAIPFGAFWAFLITSVIAAMVDSVFVIVQRYNRPRITAILERRARRTQSGNQA